MAPAKGSYKSEPAVSFSDEDIAYMVAPLSLAIIGKFSHGKPRIKDICKAVDWIGLVGSHTGVIDRKHVLLRFSHKEDFQRIWIKQVWNIMGFQMRVFKWSPHF
jgi:hypothetical protein